MSCCYFYECLFFKHPSKDRTCYDNTHGGWCPQFLRSLSMRSSLNLVIIFVGMVSQPSLLISEILQKVQSLWPLNYPKLNKPCQFFKSKSFHPLFIKVGLKDFGLNILFLKPYLVYTSEYVFNGNCIKLTLEST